MNKIMVIGCPGAGKSYFSRQLREKLNIEIIYLDCLYWKPNWISIENEEFDKKLIEVFKKDKWIMDGNYNRTMPLRMKEADTIFYLDFDTDFCLNEVYKRNGTKREDIPDYLSETEVVDEEFKNYIVNFNTVEKPKILSLLENNKDKEIHVFKNRSEINEFITNLKK